MGENVQFFPLLPPVFKLRPLKYALPHGGVLPIMAYTGKLRPKGVPLSGFRYMKG